MSSHDRDLEQLIRDGPPDEPPIVRSLVLPTAGVQPLTKATGRGAPVALRRRSGVGLAVGLGMLGVAAVALALWSIPSGSAPRVGGLATTSPSPPSSPATGQSAAPSISALAWSSPVPVAAAFSVSMPAGWHLVQHVALGDGGGPLVALANFDIEASCRAPASVGTCIASLPLVAGQILVTIANDDTAMTMAQVASPGGFDATIDGMPAVLQVVEAPPGTQVRGVGVQPGCDAHRAWWIGRPSAPTGWLDIEACSAAADRDSFRAAVDGIARSVVFRR